MLALRPQSPRRSSSPSTSSPLANPPLNGDHDDDEQLRPPRPLHSAYSRTPSLTSSFTSLDSHNDPSPPSTSHQPRPMSPTRKPAAIDSLMRNPKGLIADAALSDSPTALDPQSQSQSPTPRHASPTPPPTSTSPRPRPARSPMPSAFNNRPLHARSRSQDGVISISSYTYTSSRRPSGARRSVSSGFLLDGHQSWIVALAARPRILASLLSYIDFAEFHALCCTSKAMRGILDERQARDAVLSRFVSGYRLGLASLPDADDIRVDLRDLEALMLSQAIPLHLYPQLALDIVAGLPPTESSTRLQDFTNVHSRFVLLLRSRAPTLSFLSDLDDPQWRNYGSPELNALRELTFPAPLSFPDPNTPLLPRQKENRPPPSPEEGQQRLKKKRKTGGFLDFLLHGPTSPATPSYPRSPPLHHTGGRPHTFPAFSGHLERGSRNPLVSTILRKGSTRLPPPPPEYTPKALKEHRRRSRIMSASLSSSWRPMQSALRDYGNLPLAEEDGYLFTPPRPPHLRANSLPNSSAATSLSDGGGGRARSQSSSPSLLNRAVPTSPHDLVLASSRSRAPVCRVFVPCDTFTPSVLLACEGQLFTAGLWQYLRSGDVVCNLGHVPPSSQQTSDAVSWGWLIFTGSSLVPYRPPQAPQLNALTLPSPMYYTHLLPTFVNPRFRLTVLSRTPHLELTMMHLSSSVRSPATRSGVAKVKKFVWVGRVDGGEVVAASRAAFEGNLLKAETGTEEFWGAGGGAGEGWNVDWVVEAEGTREGKQGLVDALTGEEGRGGETEWEVVRERCAPGRLWLRLLIAPPPTESASSFSASGYVKP